MNFSSSSSSSSSDSVAIIILSLQRICRNLFHLLNVLNADIDSFERILIDVTSSIHELSSSSNIEDENDDEQIEKNEDFYEQLCDEQLEPKSLRVTTL